MNRGTIELPHPDLLKRFEALVAAAEREREACATVCELLAAEPITLTGRRDKAIWRIASKRCAAAIRARGEK
jgi:hypothetical protein